MNKKHLIGLLLSTASIASYANVNQTLNLSLILGKACFISAPNTMPFGNVTSLFSTNNQSTKSISDNIYVQCNRALVYNIGILPVNNSNLVKASTLTTKYPSIVNNARLWFTKLDGAKPGNTDGLYIDWFLDSNRMNLGDNEAAVRNYRESYIALGFVRTHVLETRLNNYGRAQLPTADSYSTTMQITIDY